MLAILTELERAICDLSRGGHFMGIMIGNWTVWPLNWLLAEIKERINLR